MIDVRQFAKILDTKTAPFFSHLAVLYLGIFRSFQKCSRTSQKFDFLFFRFFVSLTFSKPMKDTKKSTERQSTSSSQAAGLENIEPPVRGLNQPASPRHRKYSTFSKIRPKSVI